MIDYPPFDEETKEVICSIFEKEFNCKIESLEQFDKYNVKSLQMDGELDYILEFQNGKVIKGSLIDLIGEIA